jgi:alkanesulfonate monooxygenase SsuD/methylene tetrahydromethanopterin reductase-like flavin-dependent oxidoreductase (luciferase family)
MVGTLVTPVTFRHPSMLIKQALTVDHLTNGRFILGLGAGYTEREHRAFGIPYPPAGQRVGMVDETLQMLRLLETEEHVTFQGKHYHLENAPAAPKPVNGHIPLMIGATQPRMLRLTAQYADYYNVAGSYNYVRDRIADLHEHCAAIGRDPREISNSVGIFIAPVDPLSSLDRALHVIERYREAGVDEVIFGASERHRPVVEELGARLGG